MTCAEDVLIAQPFSPALFQRGPQPWPTLLLETLRGHVEESSLAERCNEASKVAQNSALLKDLEWSCARCSGTWGYTHFVSKGFNDDDWFGEYARAIIKPGVLRTCHREEFTCQLCGLSKREKQFTESMWQDRSKQWRTLCFECSHPECKVPECTTCKHCRSETCMMQLGECTAKPPVLHWRHLPKSLEEVKSFKYD